MKLLLPGPQDKMLNQTLWLVAVSDLLAMGVALVAGRWWLSATGRHAFIFCLFRRFTGHYCPMCGMTRAFTAAMHGEWAHSLAENPMGLPLIIIGMLILLWQLLALRLKYHFRPGFWAGVAKGVGGALLVNWVYLLFHF